ncbi:hypothetical protein BDR03DRAFT_978884 [Suillus americanus]|nr:hypothetical protein BDR03DRAFT_978884 [Suillus americanus]
MMMYQQPEPLAWIINPSSLDEEENFLAVQISKDISWIADDGNGPPVVRKTLHDNLEGRLFVLIPNSILSLVHFLDASDRRENGQLRISLRPLREPAICCAEHRLFACLVFSSCDDKTSLVNGKTKSTWRYSDPSAAVRDMECVCLPERIAPVQQGDYRKLLQTRCRKKSRQWHIGVYNYRTYTLESLIYRVEIWNAVLLEFLNLSSTKTNLTLSKNAFSLEREKTFLRHNSSAPVKFQTPPSTRGHPRGTSTAGHEPGCKSRKTNVHIYVWS